MTAQSPIKAIWVHPNTYSMLNAFRLVGTDHVLPRLHDGTFIFVHPLMPSTGIYDQPTRRVVELMAQDVQREIEQQEKAA